MRNRASKSVFGFLFLLILTLLFQNCNPKLSGGGEPYPGMTDTGALLPDTGTPNSGNIAGISYIGDSSTAVACPDRKPADVIVFNTDNKQLTEVRVACADTFLPIDSQNLVWTNSGQQFEYNGRTYSIKN